MEYNYCYIISLSFVLLEFGSGSVLILVVGATGDVGGAVARMLLGQGKQVRVLARQHSNYKPLADAGAEVVFGDLKNRSSLDPACKGVQTVVTTANSARRGGDDNPQTVDLEGNRNLIDAAKAAGVRHFVFVSTNMADPNSPIPFLQAKGKTEEYLRASGMPYTNIRPELFMEAWITMVVTAPALAGRPVTVVGTGSRKHSFISAGDVAKFIVACVDNPRASNQEIIIGGPGAVSFRDAASLYGRLLGREVPVRSVQLGEPVPDLPEGVLPLIAGLDNYDSVIDTSDVSRTFGIRLTSLEVFARQTISGPPSR